jgi:chromosome partitioning protein
MSQHRVAVVARKGGVGKATIACGVASILATQGKQVLVVDLDPQSNSAYALGGDPTPLEAVPGLHVLLGGPNLTNRTIQSLHPKDLADLVKAMPYDAVVVETTIKRVKS